MNDLFLLLLAGFIVAIAVNANQQPGSPTITYIPIEAPQSSQSGCAPIIVALLAALFFGLLLMGR